MLREGKEEVGQRSLSLEEGLCAPCRLFWLLGCPQWAALLIQEGPCLNLSEEEGGQVRQKAAGRAESTKRLTPWPLWLSWLERCPVNQKVAGSDPSLRA